MACFDDDRFRDDTAVTLMVTSPVALSHHQHLPIQFEYELCQCQNDTDDVTVSRYDVIHGLLDAGP